MSTVVLKDNILYGYELDFFLKCPYAKYDS